jgi:hypothetical protein
VSVCGKSYLEFFERLLTQKDLKSKKNLKVNVSAVVRLKCLSELGL